jgi:hypothetical protein
MPTPWTRNKVIILSSAINDKGVPTDNPYGIPEGEGPSAFTFRVLAFQENFP